MRLELAPGRYAITLERGGTTRKLDIDIHYYDKMIRQAEQQEAKLARTAEDAAPDE